jgi:zinc transporter ZupT
MKDVPPEVSGQIAMSLPLFALGLALFLTAFLLVAGALLSLIPQVYERRENGSNGKWRAFGLMIGIAVLCGVAGWMTLSGLSSHLIDATTIMSQVEESK